MPDATFNPMQPFINLVQANMALLSKYAMSPDAMSKAMVQLQAAMTQGPGALIMPPPATAFAELAQGVLENYARFMSELAQSGMSAFAQSSGCGLQSRLGLWTARRVSLWRTDVYA